MPHLSCLFHQGLYQTLKGSTSSPRVRDTLMQGAFWKADLDLSWHYLLFLARVFPTQRGCCHFLTLIEDWEFICRTVLQLKRALFCRSLGSTPRTANHRRNALGNCHLSNPLCLLQPQKSRGMWRCDLRGGVRPATGLQVSPSRLEGVR